MSEERGTSTPAMTDMASLSEESGRAPPDTGAVRAPYGSTMRARTVIAGDRAL
jgi:hypothetical protein